MSDDIEITADAEIETAVPEVKEPVKTETKAKAKVTSAAEPAPAKKTTSAGGLVFTIKHEAQLDHFKGLMTRVCFSHGEHGAKVTGAGTKVTVTGLTEEGHKTMLVLLSRYEDVTL